MTTISLWVAWCVAAMVVAAVLTRMLIEWTTARGIIDAPNARSSHARNTPRGGGLAIVVVVVGAIVVVVVGGVTTPTTHVIPAGTSVGSAEKVSCAFQYLSSCVADATPNVQAYPML